MQPIHKFPNERQIITFDFLGININPFYVPDVTILLARFSKYVRINHF